jgi:hypothetical protein
MAAMPVTKTYADSSHRGRETTIFVIDVSDSAAFAFEAQSSSQAEDLTRLPWFAQALEEFCLRREMTISERSLRPATDTEASTYQDLAGEFADTTNDFLVANLSYLKVKSQDVKRTC